MSYSLPGGSDPTCVILEDLEVQILSVSFCILSPGGPDPTSFCIVLEALEAQILPVCALYSKAWRVRSYQFLRRSLSLGSSELTTSYVLLHTPFIKNLYFMAMRFSVFLVACGVLGRMSLVCRGAAVVSKMLRSCLWQAWAPKFVGMPPLAFPVALSVRALKGFHCVCNLNFRRY